MADLVPEVDQFLILFGTERADDVGVGVHPDGKTVTLFGGELQIAVRVDFHRVLEQFHQAAVHGRRLAGEGLILFKRVILEIVVAERKQRLIRAIAGQVEFRRQRIVTVRRVT